jgi:hypothetical protein
VIIPVAPRAFTPCCGVTLDEFIAKVNDPAAGPHLRIALMNKQAIGIDHIS